MTLFDRRVDLARFSPDTPLYVMCREWMCNNPHKLFLDKPLYDSTQPSKPLPPTPPPNTLPLPTPLSRDSKGVVIRLDIPKPHPPHTKAREELDVILHRVCPLVFDVLCRAYWCVLNGAFIWGAIIIGTGVHDLH